MPTRFFLLLLLLLDWAGDPHNGRSPLSQPLASQPVVCHTLGRGHEQPQPDPDLCGSHLAPAANTGMWSYSAECLAVAIGVYPAAESLYVFMSLLR